MGVARFVKISFRVAQPRACPVTSMGGRTGGVMRSEAADDSDRLNTEYITTQLAQLRRIAIVLSQDQHRADDLVQEAITKLYTRWHKRHAIDHLDRYLRSILVREFLDSQRQGWTRRV